MADKDFPILITGATGQQGGSVAGNLVGKDFKNIRVLTRHPEKAKIYRDMGIDVFKGDLREPSTLKKAMKGVKKLFLVTTPYEEGVEAEIDQGISAIDAAREAGVQHVIYSSVCSAHRETGIPHFESKWKIEHHLVQSGLPYTILRPAWFFENYQTFMLPAIQSGRVSTPLLPDRPLQQIAVQDVGEFAAAAIERPDEFIGLQLDIAGEALTFPEVLTILGNLAGKTIEYVPMSLEESEKAYGHDFTVMYDWFNRVGYNVDIPTLQQTWDIPLTKFRDWIGISKMTVAL